MPLRTVTKIAAKENNKPVAYTVRATKNGIELTNEATKAKKVITAMSYTKALSVKAYVVTGSYMENY